MKPRRRLQRAAGFLVLGATTTFAVAVLTSLGGTLRADAIVITPRPPGDVAVVRFERFGAVTMWTTTMGAKNLAALAPIAEHQVDGPAARIVPWGMRDGSNELTGLREVESERHYIDSAVGRGWPFLALWCEQGGTAALSGGHLLKNRKIEHKLGSATFVTPAVLPLRPLWLGFAANSVIYGAAWASAFWSGTALRRAARRAYRRRRGRCLECGYDRRGLELSTPCPECGHVG